MARLVNRTDVWGQYLPLDRRERKRGGKTLVETAVTAPPVRARGRVALSLEVLERHFRGDDPGDVVGVHATSADGTCRAIGWDIDAHDGDGRDPAANWRAAEQWYLRLTSQGFHVLLTDSNGKGGYHLRVMLDRPVPTARVYPFAQGVVSGYAAFGFGDAPETFPKQAALRGKKMGNWMRLPGRHHTRDHWTRVWDGERWLAGAAAVEFVLNLPPSSADLVPEPSADPGRAATTPVAPQVKPKPQRVAAADGARVSDRDVAVQCLHALDPGLHYDRWVEIGMALHAVDDSPAMLDEWDRWSRRAADRYTPGTCREKWGTFERGGGRNLGSLVYWARQAGGRVRFRPGRATTGAAGSAEPGRDEDEAVRDEDGDESAAERAIRDAMVDAQAAGTADPIFDAAPHFADLTPAQSAKIRAELRAWKLAAGIDLDMVDLRTVVKHARGQARAERPPVVRAAAEPGDTYRMTPAGIVWNRMTQEGVAEVMLTNFEARIVADVLVDDGVERTRAFEVDVARGGDRRTLSLPAARFDKMDWVSTELGTGWVVHAGSAVRDHARAAIQILSTDVRHKVVYGHLGWRRVGDEWLFLHAGGAIGRDGLRTDVDVSVGDALGGYSLPDPPTGPGLAEAVRSSLGMLHGLGPDRVVVPPYCAVWRSVLGGSDFSSAIIGPTGAFKSELAALNQQHFGAGMDARHLPANWSSTENALEGLAFAAKDVLCVVDEFAPNGSTVNVQQLHGKADRVIRAQGNHAGRQRMRADGALRPAKAPRGLLLMTGEDVPNGQSVQARLFVTEVGPGDVVPDRLTQCQLAAARGDFAAAMAGFVRWLATPADLSEQSDQPAQPDVGRPTTDGEDGTCPRGGQDGRIGLIFRNRGADIRHLGAIGFGGGHAHRRTSAAVASLAYGLTKFLEFAIDVGAVSEAEAEGVWQRARVALSAVADGQRMVQAQSDPVTRFLELLGAAVASGEAHVAAVDGGLPPQPGAWGWRARTDGAGLAVRDGWQPFGPRVGWVEGEYLYLEPNASYVAAFRLAAGGEGLAIKASTLRKRMVERGVAMTESEEQTTVRKMICGRRQRVVKVSTRALSVKGVQSVQSVQPTDIQGEYEAVPWTGN
jgi:hypothetical protein